MSIIEWINNWDDWERGYWSGAAVFGGMALLGGVVWLPMGMVGAFFICWLSDLIFERTKR